MAWNNKPLWYEGMFMRPQHLQQHDRYLEAFVESRSGALRPHAWGVTKLTLDPDLLALGKVSLAACRGVMPDGAPVNVPEDDEVPPARDIGEKVFEKRVFLGLPVRRSNGLEVDEGEGNVVGRYRPVDFEARDTTTRAETPVGIRVGQRNYRLLIEGEPMEEYVTMPIARIKEVRSDGAVVLSDGFLPPALDCAAHSGFTSMLKEIEGLLRHRGEALAGRVDPSGRSGGGGIADFLMLQLVNRYEPLFAHFARLVGLHPEAAYQAALMLAGEVSSFATKNRRPAAFPAYKHDDLENVFPPVLKEIRNGLSQVIEDAAVAIPLEKRKYGIYVAQITDRSLLRGSDFVFAVSASVSSELLRTRFPSQVKIGPVEDIRDLVNLQLPGIGLKPMPVAPRQLPFHSGFTYFQLDQTVDLCLNPNFLP